MTQVRLISYVVCMATYLQNLCSAIVVRLIGLYCCKCMPDHYKHYTFRGINYNYTGI